VLDSLALDESMFPKRDALDTGWPPNVMPCKNVAPPLGTA
jgi:hypothetical protein